MRSRYNPAKIESKWQEYWEKEGLHQAKDFGKNPKSYILVEFPYPSGDGLHIGHCRPYIALDVVSRKRRMEGNNVLFPMGWDAFGLPTENYAIKTGIHPRKATEKNTIRFKKQQKKIGLSFDWSREINTTDPEYYKWTQWIFVQLFKKGLAYKAKIAINWCPSCKIGLANEEVVNGKCERCGHKVEKKEKEQWMLKITKYADRLIKDLDRVDYPEKVKIMQKEWIGKSEGALIKFQISKSKCQISPAQILRSKNCGGQESKVQIPKNYYLEVFTTRPDTLFGATYMVVAPEHKIISDFKTQISNTKEVKDYIQKAQQKSDLERTDLAKEKTGIQLKGVWAINPVNSKEIPIFAADYVLPHYGTGAIMAVPAHDERDFEFARKYGLPIIQTTALNLRDYNRTIKNLELLQKVQKAAKELGIKIWLLGGLACAFYTGVIYRRHEDLDLAARTESEFHKLVKIFESLGLKKIKEKKLNKELSNLVFRADNGIEVDIGPNKSKFGLKEADFEIKKKQLVGYNALVLSKRFIKSFKEMQIKERGEDKDKLDMEFLNGRVITENGFAVNSQKFDDLPTTQFKKEIIKWLGKKGLAKKEISYKLRDWVFSRQHYWGEPIPMVECEKCGWVAVVEKDLPVELPEVRKYQSTDTGESPLAGIKNWGKTKCPKCKGPAQRETDTMPNWAGSNWYFLRYCDPKNSKQLASSDKLKYWMPVDWYNGGMEHTTVHLLYSRFIYKFLWDIGAVPKSCGTEPYKKRTSHGVVLGEGWIKMSKSRGNVVVPDEVIKQYGADTLRVYEMFMGPFEQMIAWDSKGVMGARRFLEKIWNLSNKFIRQKKESKSSKALKQTLHKTIKKVSEDIENLKFNTGVSAMMEFVNAWQKESDINKEDFENFLKILAPFAPHLAEEFWEKLGRKQSIFLEKWPQYDAKLVKEEKITLVVQINGKVRDKIEVRADISEKEAKETAMASQKIQKWLAGKKPRKIIFVQGRLINIVV